MINIKNVKKFCNEDITQIENYDKAISDTTQTWHCHHRKETNDNISRNKLIELNLYYKRPADELIFLTKSEHYSLHSSGKNNTMYGKHLSEERKNKISITLTGKPHPHTKEQDIKIGNSLKGNKNGIGNKGNTGKHRVYDKNGKYHYEW